MANYRVTLIEQLESLYLEVRQSEADAALIDQGLVPTAEYSSDGGRAFKLSIVSIIPRILAKPDISEGGYSVKYDRNAVAQYYGWLTDELGVENALIPKPRMRDASWKW